MTKDQTAIKELTDALDVLANKHKEIWDYLERTGRPYPPELYKARALVAKYKETAHDQS